MYFRTHLAPGGVRAKLQPADGKVTTATMPWKRGFQRIPNRLHSNPACLRFVGCKRCNSRC